ncbi:hypothetical protein SAMN04490248_1843 [Salinihabitans flavidus]|uniref:Uncharacterized protein n=1 Tax=Salinihabitans flavidus TaxID=569882 RepID=A0A1H8WM92_9RHOB|nr:hypothetical protein [Salinihabitans flavidus]SEP28761.1 hypothetical protein SAMN04490248_1843 [Salinihabitans flavidus]
MSAAAIAGFFARIHGREGEDLQEAFANEAIETGGHWWPTRDPLNGQALFEIHLHGVTAIGLSLDDAIRSWRRKARARLEDPNAA